MILRRTIEEAQRIKRDERRIELDSILGQVPLARARAEEMRARGNLAGELVLSRIKVDNAQHHPVTCQHPRRLCRFEVS